VNPDELDLLEQVVLQIRAGDAREQGGHRPTMNFPTSEAAGALCIEGICSTYAPMSVGALHNQSYPRAEFQKRVDLGG
jgi:hypothetical protein